MDYITCHHRKAWPTIPTVVCEKCKRMGNCADYQNYIHLSLFPNFSEIDDVKRKVGRKRIKPEDTETNGPEQLSFNLLRRC
jgi:hypothetical protein